MKFAIEVSGLGKDIRSHAADILGRINLSSGHANFLWGLKVRENLAGIYEFELKNSTCSLMVDNHRQRLPQILDVFAHSRAGVDDIQIRESDLEDVFITLAKF